MYLSRGTSLGSHNVETNGQTSGRIGSTGMTVRNEIITSLAILLVNWDHGKDYIDNFVPFVGQCIVSLHPEVISAEELQKKLRHDYGLQVPQNTIKSILKKATRKGYVQKRDDAYLPNYDVLQALNFETIRQDVLRQHNALVQKMIEFANKRYELSLTADVSEDMLLSFVKMHDVEVLSCIVSQEVLPEIQAEPDPKHSYVVQAFVKHIYESDPECSKYLDAIVKGHMLANALILPDMGNIRRGFHRTSVYCDTGFILRALGYEGPAYQGPCRELIDLLSEVGATICCFRTTRNELYNILYACRMALATVDRRNAYGPAFRHFSRFSYTPSDLELEMATLDKKIEKLGIRIMEKPEPVDKYQVDEPSLEGILQNVVSYPPDRERARKHDVECLSAIFRLRKGQSYFNMEECYALFVTPNSNLCRVNVEFFVKGGYISEGSVPIAITDYALTNILWLKKPMTAPDLPRKYVIAQCYAAMEPTEGLWHRYLDKIKKLRERKEISEDEYYLLRETQIARTDLAEITMGDGEAFVEGTPQEILERITQSIRETDLKKLASEIERREKAEHQLSLEQDRTSSWEKGVRRNIERISRRAAFIISRIVFVIVDVALLTGALYGFFRPNFVGWPQWILLLLGIAFVLVSTILLFTGKALKDLVDRFQNCLAFHIQHLLTFWFLPTE